MGKKSTPSRNSAPSLPRKPRKAVIAGVLTAAIAGGAIAVGLLGRSSPPPAADTATTSTSAPGAVADPPAAARFGPHAQEKYPPLPTTGYPPPRSMEVVSAAYKFAAEHPEVLGYVPCYCGCDRQGHRGNDDCFVARRDGKGDVLEWDAHGMT